MVEKDLLRAEEYPDIKQCYEKAIHYTASMDFKPFYSNEVIYDAVIRNWEIIGEPLKTSRNTFDLPTQKLNEEKY
ncbi:MAG: DUF86 domain-containing protein [Rhabdochlamydiaceae bacterium]|nr:DUF86 domain-containing protein [Rhabdochlamydiaceae bacterium]